MIRILAGFVFCLISISTTAQGCSDAGFCTMGAMRPNQHYNKKLKLKLRSIEYNFYRGTAIVVSPVIFAHTIDFNTSLGENLGIQLKIPYMHINGNLGSNSGLGDISISATRAILVKPNWSINGTIGGKIPTNDSNTKISSPHSGEQSVPLHMYYQTSLGSFDLVGGMSWISQKWLIAAGIQAALTENNNQFRWGDWSGYPDQEYILNHNTGNQLKRGTDIMYRIERNVRFTNFDFSLGLLHIVRVTKDEVFKPDTGERTKLDGTLGSAISALGSFGYHFDINHGIRLIYGHKIMNRAVNPDGLTRHNVMSMSYIYRF